MLLTGMFFFFFVVVFKSYIFTGIRIILIISLCLEMMKLGVQQCGIEGGAEWISM